MPKLFLFFIAVLALVVWLLPLRQLPPGEAAFVVPHDTTKSWCFVPPQIAPEFQSALVRTKQKDTTDPQPAYLILVGMYFVAFYGMTSNGRFASDLREVMEKVQSVAWACAPIGALMYYWNRQEGE